MIIDDSPFAGMWSLGVYFPPETIARIVADLHDQGFEVDVRPEGIYISGTIAGREGQSACVLVATPMQKVRP